MTAAPLPVASAHRAVFVLAMAQATAMICPCEMVTIRLFARLSDTKMMFIENSSNP